MSESTTYLRTCPCGTKFEPPLDRRDQTECRKCSGLVCPLCSGPTLDGRVCPRHEPQEARPEIKLVRARRTA